ncbi:hypothetical protein K8089_03485 [Aequorivita sp. F47161]|uniref:Transglutaminase-like domain-containing protein n=1 Tax=Aequorivita vitellina TaxID=2874475 RepID=A0A9X1QV96_9FLAO|nr:transglutaminase domain-containing protein [Aequorivita vitellina]MCG2418072.1 hypothetical protein [Aequorivita vitellina]MCZ4317616.1 hypothetical protein [Aequorivita viscosa]
MRIRYLLLLLVCFVAFSSAAQIGAVIGKAGGTKERPVNKKKTSFSTEKLAFAITKDATSEKQKVRAIYNWITANISYDNELRLSAALQNEFYTSEEKVLQKVLERKMALCGGFAFLFESLCKNVGIAAEVIHGFTKDYSGKIVNSKKPNHTWNAVKIDGQWQLLDITWAISYGNNKGTDDFWFFTKPSNFIYTHYPMEQKWTLLEQSISLSEFQKPL